MCFKYKRFYVGQGDVAMFRPFSECYKASGILGRVEEDGVFHPPVRSRTVYG